MEGREKGGYKCQGQAACTEDRQAFNTYLCFNLLAVMWWEASSDTSGEAASGVRWRGQDGQIHQITTTQRVVCVYVWEKRKKRKAAVWVQRMCVCVCVCREVWNTKTQRETHSHTKKTWESVERFYVWKHKRFKPLEVRTGAGGGRLNSTQDRGDCMITN